MVFLDRRLEHPELLTPTGETARIPVPVPQIPAATVERATGRLVLYAPESLRVNPFEPMGLRSVSKEINPHGCVDKHHQMRASRQAPRSPSHLTDPFNSSNRL